MAVGLSESITRAVANLPDDELICQLQCAQRCALIATRGSRELARLRMCCLARELDRRKRARSPETRPTLLSNA